MRDFRQLRVWERSHALVLRVYRATEDFPPTERFGLTSQMRRAAAAVPANVAEGCGRGGREFGRFVTIAMGSASELEYHLLLARDLGFLKDPDYVSLQDGIVEVKKMLFGLVRQLKADS